MLFYKIGCYVLILSGLFHLSGHFQELVATNDTERQLFGLMETYPVNVPGATVTMANILDGYSLWFALTLIWSGAMSLFLVKQLGENRAFLLKIAGFNASALLIGSGISLLYFFFIPTICLVLGLISFSVATIQLKR